MHHRSAWRLVAGPAAAIAAALSLTTPVLAAAATTLDVELTAVTLGVGAQTPIETLLSASPAATLVSPTVRYEISGLTGVTVVSEDSYCESFSGTVLVCARPFELEVGPSPEAGHFGVALKASGSAVAGESGTLTATFGADGVTEATDQVTITVADDVDLAAGESYALGVTPGEAFTASLRVTNTTAKVVRGADVRSHAGYAFEAAEKFSNCVYREDDRLTGCVFEHDLLPGTTYEVALPFTLRKDTMAPGASAGEFEWLTAGDHTDDRKATTAGTLRLTPVASAGRAPRTGGDPEDSWQAVTVNATGKQGADIAAVGTQVHGEAGAVVDATFGLRNNGPATIDSSRPGDAAGVVLVTVPSGTTVTKVPESCSVAEYDRTDLDAVQYYCGVGPLFPAGETVTWTFGLRIATVQVDATGAVESNPACQCARFDQDIDRSNDRAELIVNPAGRGALPIAGPRGVMIGLTGALLLAAGIAAFLMVRNQNNTVANDPAETKPQR
ncbi:hypothetical protein FB565_001957 [Actinoplanes lutulentus]|uniref:Repeat protein (TIGR01451 family) n=1 Tax=Actinoplanes lutulentus TaxID=1287878 RepID=A0A327ZF65_9ACTN|nr:hypothetical protein [Actinoplanes lutulentus]MBB2942244.1 hypothetical protein [Actinoplanes lutulentus]RAK33013.1 hypothetical protein B0I29_11244 [Actinoplanes lutulentus]